MILGEDFAVSQLDQQSMWSGGGFTEVMALAGSWCERVRRLGILYCGIAMRLGHSSSHVGAAMSFFLQRRWTRGQEHYIQVGVSWPMLNCC